jgi:acetyl esterase
LPYVSPLRATSLQGLPATLVICAEIDPLLHENREYGRRLEQAGIPVELLVYPGMFHGFCAWEECWSKPSTRSIMPPPD